jgi:acyl-CoA thioester hydrolase
MTLRSTWSPQPWRAAIRDEWIDYNGHLRDAYYTLLASEALDDLMEQVGLDASYRAETGATLYTLEIHAHFLQEVKRDDAVTVVTRPLGTDSKRLHVYCEIRCPRLEDPAAVVEVLLLHVQQHPAPKSAPFPAAVAGRLSAWLADSAPVEFKHRSRAMGLQRRDGGS